MNKSNIYTKHILSNGIRVICEKVEGVRSVSVGIWAGAGSRFETKANNGVSHFLEHMLFKGTRTRSAKQIAEEIDAIGGQINAFTGKECTCYYTKTLDERLDVGIDILSDIILNSKLAMRDISVERNVILEEINMYEDSPEDLVHDLLTTQMWGKSTLGMPVLGTGESLNSIDKACLKEYISQKYVPANIVISVAGSFDEAGLVKMLDKKFAKLKSNNTFPPVADKPRFCKGAYVKQKDTEQIHICIGMKGIETGHDDIYTLNLINYIFGGGMSSILFQKIREELGLVYSIYSYGSAFKHAGQFVIYAGMNPEQFERVYSLIWDELKKFKAAGLDEDSLHKAKEQFRGNYLLSLEGSMGRMSSLGKSELLLGRVHTPEEILNKVDRISLKAANELINRIISEKNYAVAAVGKVDNAFFNRVE